MELLDDVDDAVVFSDSLVFELSSYYPNNSEEDSENINKGGIHGTKLT